MSPISGQFPKLHEDVKKMPLRLARCSDCGLIQLLDKLPIAELYSETYGYESHLNLSMKNHLQTKAKNIQSKYFNESDKIKIVDIASNDGTLLAGYENNTKLELFGIDPLISNFNDFYPIQTRKVNDFFTEKVCEDLDLFDVDLVTTISMFYDLDNPIEFAQNVWNILKQGGIWHLEQSYCPTMVDSLSFDTICHEHLLYLKAQDFNYIFNKVGFEVIEVEKNSINGGSLAITVKKNSNAKHCDSFNKLIESEKIRGFDNLKIYKEFADKILIYRQNLVQTLIQLKSQGFNIVGLGASTKGNVILEFCKLDSTFIKHIGDVNPKKIGRVTPGTNIPIVSEEVVLNDTGSKVAALVLPWHFKETFLEKTKKFRASGNKIIFPLPEITVY